MASAPPAPGSLLAVHGDAVVHAIAVTADDQTLVINDAVAHVFIHAGSEARGTVFIELQSVSQCAMEIVLDARSHASVVVLDRSPEIRLSQRTHIADHATLQLMTVSLGARTEADLESAVHGPNGVSSVDWLSYAKNAETQRLAVRNSFHERAGGGEVTMRAVGEGKATVGVKGMIDIESGGGGTHTYLTQQVLMLDPVTKIDASPALEIKTNDVKASHSASVSRLTPEDLYYFQARGVDPQEARGLLVKGFLGEFAERIAHAGARDAVIQAIEEKYARI